MARFDRCSVCNYCQADGDYPSGVVRRYENDYLCDGCFQAIRQNLKDITPPEKGEVPYDIED